MSYVQQLGASNPELMLQIEDEDRCLLVSSARRGEGKSFVTAGIGWLLSRSSQRRTAKGILLVDANFRSPALHQLFCIPNRQGLADALAGDLDVSRLIQPIREGLALLTTGGFGVRSKGSFEIETMRKVFLDLTASFDRVLVDSAAVLDYPDTRMMAPLFDGILLVAESGITSVSDLRLARNALEKAGGRLSGVIMNRSPIVATPARQTDRFPEVFFR